MGDPGRVVEVSAERLPKWCKGFAERHGGPLSERRDGSALVLTAADGATAALGPAFALPDGVTDLAGVLAWAAEPRRCAVVLVRRGGYACAVVETSGAVPVSKVGRCYVQSRTAAGGWSQQRFARRRENQARDLTRTAADEAARLVAPGVGRGDWLVTGGDRPLVDAVLADPRLRVVAGLARGPHLPIGDPRADTVRTLPAKLRTVRVTLSP